MNKVNIPQEVMTTFTEDGAVLLNMKSNVYYALNGSGAEFWKALTDLHSIDQSLERMAKIYGLESINVLEQDINEIVESLVQEGLLEEIE